MAKNNLKNCSTIQYLYFQRDDKPKRPRISRKWIGRVTIGATGRMIHWGKVF